MDDDEAFRLWVRLTPAALTVLRSESSRQATQLRNVCVGKSYNFGGFGRTHPDFCKSPVSDFDDTVKLAEEAGLRGIQFNFNSNCSDCSDIDIDYTNGFCHDTRGNSDVLDDCWHMPGYNIDRFCE